jgi:putative glutamine amidotransferase
MAAMKPVIGITTYGRFEHDMNTAHYAEFYVLPADYALSVRRAGGVPLYLPPGEDLFPGVLDRLDGIIFSGGADMPILCICRGFQLLNVALGGSLVEHVPDLGNGDIHRSEGDNWTLHEAEIVERESRIARVLGPENALGTSGHHQALRRVAEPLAVTARAPDGLVEAVEHRAHPWCLGVQWHPEVTAGTDPVQQRLFDALVREAGERGGWRL